MRSTCSVSHPNTLPNIYEMVQLLYQGRLCVILCAHRESLVFSDGSQVLLASGSQSMRVLWKVRCLSIYFDKIFLACFLRLNEVVMIGLVPFPLTRDVEQCCDSRSCHTAD